MSLDANLLILERSKAPLTQNEEYILSGVFGQIGVKNKNNRIYDEEELLPQIDELQEKIKANTLLGELDHPEKFDISLSKVSHTIQELYYEKETGLIKGKLQLLDTTAGKEAKALVNAGVPIHISSRAAGSVKGDGHVSIEKLFTYDLVADPGFENATLERVSESFGLNESSNLQIFQLPQESNKNEINTKEETMSNDSNTVTVEDFNKYSQYISEEINKLKNDISNINDSKQPQTDNSELKKYVEYLSESVDNIITHNDYIVNNLNDTNEKVDSSISFSNYIAEEVNKTNTESEKLIKYTNYLAENLTNVTEYANYLAENLQNNADYSDYLGENLTNIIKYSNYLKENTEKVGDYSDYLGENLQKVIQYTNHLAENIDPIEKIEEAPKVEAPEVEVTEEIETEVQEVEATEEVITEPTEEVIAEEVIEEETTEEAEIVIPETNVQRTSHVEKTYKSDIAEKLEDLINAAHKTTAATDEEKEDLHFLKFVDQEKKDEFNGLSEEDKETLVNVFESKNYVSASDVLFTWKNALSDNVPVYIQLMPDEYKSEWNAMSEEQKNLIHAQSSNFNLYTQYQVQNFWSTRNLKGSKVVLEKLESNNKEAVKYEPKRLVDQDYLDGFQKNLSKRFKK